MGLLKVQKEAIMTGERTLSCERKRNLDDVDIRPPKKVLSLQAALLRLSQQLKSRHKAIWGVR